MQLLREMNVSAINIGLLLTENEAGLRDAIKRVHAYTEFENYLFKTVKPTKVLRPFAC